VRFSEELRTLRACWAATSAGKALSHCEVNLRSDSDLTGTLHRVVHSAGHSRHANAALALDKTRAFATGSDDATVKIWEVNNDSLVLQQTLTGHVSGVRALASVTLKATGVVVLFSGGGSSELRSWHGDPARAARESFRAIGRLALPSDHNDLCRVMAVSPRTLLVGGAQRVFVFLGMSDGRVVIVPYDAQASSRHVFSGVSTAHLHDCSVISVATAQLSDPGTLVLFSGGTDGVLWATTVSWHESSQELRVVAKGSFRGHQCGVNDIEAAPFALPGGDSLEHVPVVSAGDDQCLVAATLVVRKGTGGAIEVVRFGPVCDPLPAHNAAITGISAAWGVSGCRVVSTGADQRLNEWNVLFEGADRARFDWIRGGAISVPDAADVALTDAAALVVGAGVAAVCCDEWVGLASGGGSVDDRGSLAQMKERQEAVLFDLQRLRQRLEELSTSSGRHD
jgi:WD40 repeat protein